MTHFKHTSNSNLAQCADAIHHCKCKASASNDRDYNIARSYSLDQKMKGMKSEMVNVVNLAQQRQIRRASMTSVNYILSKIAEYVLLMFIGGFVYTICEMLYRTYSHWSMFIVGGLCLIIVGLLNECILPGNWGLIPQSLVGAIAITVVEFVCGLIVNVWLNLNVWDYSNLPLNIMGQVCLPFTLIWVVLALVAIVVDDRVRYRFFGEPKPTYVWWMR